MVVQMARSKDRRKSEQRHIRLPHSVTGSAAWRDLSGNAVKLLVAMMRYENGTNNGNIFYSSRLAADDIGVAPNTAWRALRQLDDHGFIKPTQVGYFEVKGGPATSWRLTWHSAHGKCATFDFRKWEGNKNKNRSQFRRSAVAEIATTSETRAPSVAENSRETMETSPSVIERVVAENDTQTVYQGLPSKIDPDMIRDQLNLLLNGGEFGLQTKVADAAAISGGRLSKFRHGKGKLTTIQLRALRKVLMQFARVPTPSSRSNIKSQKHAWHSISV